jgi:SPP1 gp7 family putative phage head morphogenesis protein
MSGIPPINPAARSRSTRQLRQQLRLRAGEFLTRFNRHDVLMARAVRGVQIEAVQEFRRMIARPLIESIGKTLAGFDARGRNVTPEQYPEIRILLAEIDEIIRRGILELRNLTEQRLEEVGQREADFVAENVEKTTDETVGRVAAPDPSQQRVLGDKPEQWFDEMLQGPTGNNVRRRLLQGLEEGETVDQIVRGIKGTRTEEGILGKSETGVDTLVRTAATSESAAAREETFRELEITHWRFVATLDSRTTLRCATEDGEVYKVGEGPVPPLHPNCRSTVVPDFGEEPFGTRAAFDGQVEAGVTFEEWLTTRPHAEQEEMLGKTKATAWRRGNITMQQLLGTDLEPLTLLELGNLDKPR